MTSLALQGCPVGLLPEPVPTEVTNASIAPPSNAFCSSPYPWSWSQVSTSLMAAGSYRLGLTWLPLASLLGLFVSRLPEPPAPGVMASPLTLGVPEVAWKGSPAVFAALGEG